MLKFQYFGHLMQTADSLEKTLMLGKIEHRRRGRQEDETAGGHHRCDEHELGQTLGDGEGQEDLVYCSPWGSRVCCDWVTEQQHYTRMYVCVCVHTQKELPGSTKLHVKAMFMAIF